MLPDYEEVVGHPPTPPPPYSETPPVVTSALLQQVSQIGSASAPGREDEARSGVERQAAGSPSGQEAGSVLSQAEHRAEENVRAPLMAAEVEEEEEEEDEELVTRRRHVTGDSGIEVCVCQVDVDECSGLEEESDDEHRTCKRSSRDCCSGPQQTLKQKDPTSELPNQTASTSTADHIV